MPKICDFSNIGDIEYSTYGEVLARELKLNPDKSLLLSDRQVKIVTMNKGQKVICESDFEAEIMSILAGIVVRLDSMEEKMAEKSID